MGPEQNASRMLWLAPGVPGTVPTRHPEMPIEYYWGMTLAS